MAYNTDGTPATSTDPDGGVTSYAYNSLHQLTTVTPPTSGSLKPVTLTYDGFGRIATVNDGNGNTVTYTYDLADRITKEAYTGGSRTLTVTYAYDGAGNLKTQTDASGDHQLDLRRPQPGADQERGLRRRHPDLQLRRRREHDLRRRRGRHHQLHLQRPGPAGLADRPERAMLWEFAYNAAGERTTTWFDTNSTESDLGRKIVDQLRRIRPDHPDPGLQRGRRPPTSSPTCRTATAPYSSGTT